METEKTLAEIARAVLATDAPTDPGEFRQKAGLLALLCLLGIVESFYGRDQVGAAQDESSVSLEGESDLMGTVASLARKLLGERKETVAPASVASLFGPSLPRRTEIAPTDSPGDPVGETTQAAIGPEAKDAAPALSTPKSRPPSGLQEVLGVDPRLITLGLNMLAEFMKNRPPERPATPPAEVPAARDRPPAAPQESPQKLYHQPGRGIYRPKPDASN